MEINLKTILTMDPNKEEEDLIIKEVVSSFVVAEVGTIWEEMAVETIMGWDADLQITWLTIWGVARSLILP